MISFRRKIVLSYLSLFAVFSFGLFVFFDWIFDEKINQALSHYPTNSKNDIKFLVLKFVTFSFLVYTSISYGIVNYWTRPIQKILKAIVPYQEGKEEMPPKIDLKIHSQDADMYQLASTLNALRQRIHNQIENLVGQTQETQGILESLAEGIIAVDVSAKVIFINQAALNVLAVTKLSVIGKSLKDLNHPLALSCHDYLLQTLQTSEQAFQKLSIHPFHFRLSTSLLPNHRGALLVLQDKTADYKMVEIGKDFIANASHELRTPITIIRGYAETLQDLPDMTEEMSREIVSKIVKTCGRLDSLVKSLLNLANIENFSKDRFKKVNLNYLIENCSHIITTAHPQTTLEIKEKQTQLYVNADADLLELAILNLLENAVKYSIGAAFIDLEIIANQQSIDIHIQDKGIGIFEEDLPHIFERFYTADKARSRKKGGTGLGLSIVKTVIDKHDGQVTVTSTPGQGSKFSISIPCFKGSL
jgi:two-component system phosphate regulon sensor histidine kinase PhoR